MGSQEIFDQMREITKPPQFLPAFAGNAALVVKIAAHRTWFQSIRRERPNPVKHYKIGAYIRYFNQTRYENYLDYHKAQFENMITQCPNWELVDFYVDEGASAPNMESAPAWCRLLEDCSAGKIDLILTQKVSNVSKKAYEITFCSKLLAKLDPPVGIYFISEDIFTLASYFINDPADNFFLPGPECQPLPEETP